MFGVPEDQVTDEQRKAAKRRNFGKLYGAGPARLEQYGIPAQPQAAINCPGPTASACQLLKQRIEALLAPYDELLHLECDGFTRVASYVLTKAGIQHEVYGGYVETKDDVVQPHFWVLAWEGVGGPSWTVDFRLRMWLGAQAPHGVFEPDPARYNYEGDLMPGFTCDDLVYYVLTGKEPIR